MKVALDKFRSDIQLVNQYYRDALPEIARTNLATLKFCCITGMVFLVAFCLLAPHIIKSWAVTPEYYIALLVFVVFFFVYLALRRSKAFYPKRIQLVCALFYGACLASLIGISVFPYPATPQYYLSVFYIFMPVILIQRPTTPIITMALCQTVFLVLAGIYKTPACLEQDIFNSFASVAFSLIVLLLVNRLRISDYNARAELRELGRIDGLTGLLNKTSFEELGSAVLPNNAPAVEGSALLVIDLDNFKEVNDHLGHQAGDDLLINVSLVLKHIFRSTDMVGRFGGDEFCVLMRGVTQQSVVEQKLHLLRSALADMRLTAGEKGVSCSIGVAFPVTGAVPYADAFRVADDNMYAVKSGGKCGYRISPVSEKDIGHGTGAGTEPPPLTAFHHQ